MKLIFIIILLFFSNLISANELENSEVEVINLHESKSLDQMVLENLIKYENKKQLIIFEIGYNQLKPIQKLLKNSGFQLISVEKDISDIPRCIVTKRI